MTDISSEVRSKSAAPGGAEQYCDTPPLTQESIKNLITLYETWNKTDMAEEWRAKLAQTEDFKE